MLRGVFLKKSSVCAIVPASHLLVLQLVLFTRSLQSPFKCWQESSANSSSAPLILIASSYSLRRSEVNCLKKVCGPTGSPITLFWEQRCVLLQGWPAPKRQQHFLCQVLHTISYGLHSFLNWVWQSAWRGLQRRHSNIRTSCHCMGKNVCRDVLCPSWS